MTDTAEDARSGRSASVRRKRSLTLFIRDIVIIFLVAVLASFLIKTFLVRTFYIPSGSMENTLQINDRIIVNELEPRLMPIHHGDVVVFTDPGGWLRDLPPARKQNPVAAGIDWALSVVGLTAPDSDNHLVKRVIGLPGDRVTCCNVLGQLTVNGSPLKEPYIVVPPGQDDATLKFDVTVPKDALWVMGDNRYNSQDSSRNQSLPGKGFVPIKDVVGRAILISWPVNRWTWLDDYPTVFAGVDDRHN